MQRHDMLHYLGVQLTHNGCAPIDNIDLAGMLEKLKKAPLKVNQRFCMLRLCLLPRLLHQLVLSLPTVKVLRRLDLATRNFAQKSLLCAKISNGFLHSPVAAGGMG